MTLGLGEDASQYEFLRIGTQSEKESVEKELQELRERLANIEGLKQRRENIDAELNKVWVQNGDTADGGALEQPSYQSSTAET